MKDHRDGLALERDVTDAEMERALQYLRDTGDGLAAELDGLDEAQWGFRPAPGRWSLADIVEHLAAVESVVLGRIVPRLPLAPAPADGDDRRALDALILRLEPDPAMTVVAAGRVSLGEAPAPLAPTGRRPPREAWRAFVASRDGLAAFLETTGDLRQHVVEQPAIGPLDGYQWMLFVAAHSDRHLKQVRGVKAHPAFPAASPAAGA